jgi:benzoate membrane transport protein
MRDFTPSAIFIGILAALVGFASTFALVLAGLRSVGATDAQAASGLMALLVTCGLSSIILSWKTRIPIAGAWSAPGAALLILTGEVAGGFAAAVGAFLICAVLIIVSGLVKPFARLVASIPTPLAAAMLAGVLLPICLAPMRAIGENVWFGLPILVAWIIGLRLHRLLAVPFALAGFLGVMIFGIDLPADWASGVGAAIIPDPQFVTPVITVSATLSIALPLFVVTMASQNVPGLAVLHAFGYRPDQGPLIATTGVLSFTGAFFGGHAINLAAITAAMVVGDEAGPDPARRWAGAVVNGIAYIVIGLTAGASVAFVSLAPPVLIEAVAGLALVFALITATQTAFANEDMRAAAAVTFLAAASGITIIGVSGAFWGLLAGIAMTMLVRRKDA